MSTDELLHADMHQTSESALQGVAPSEVPTRLAALEAWGVNLGLIRLNLSWTPTHRLEVMEGVVEAGIQLRQQRDFGPPGNPIGARRFSLMPLFRGLAAARVRYVCTGSLAAMLQGVPCVTERLELCCDPTSANLAALLNVLSERPEGDTPALIDTLNHRLASTLAAALRRGECLELKTTPAIVALMTRVPGIGLFPAVWRHAHKLDLDGLAVRVGDLEAILTSKQHDLQASDAFLLPHLEATILLKRLEGPTQP